MSHYGDRSQTREDRIKSLIEKEIYCCQSALVDDLLQSGDRDGWTIDDIENLYPNPAEWTVETCKDWASDEGVDLSGYTQEELDAGDDDFWEEIIRDNATPAEPLEWWAVSRTLCGELRKLGKVIIDNDFGYWWGRCTSGQSIEMDGVWDRWCDMRGNE